MALSATELSFPAKLAQNRDRLEVLLPFQSKSPWIIPTISSTNFWAITEIGWDVKQRAKDKGFARGFVLGLANDHGGYFTTLKEYEARKYEGQSTLYGPTTGELVVESADNVMDAVK